MMGDNRAVYFGEVHSHWAVKDELSERMPEFASLGFTHLGMEFFSVDFQPTLDTYFETGERSKDVLDYLARVSSLGGQVNEASLEKGKKYMQIVEAARENGLRILALDLHQAEFDKRLEEIEEEFYAGNGGRINELQGILNDRREETMQRVTAGVLEDPRAKIINLTGAAHNDRISRKVEGTPGEEGVSIDFTGQERIIEVMLFDYAAQRAGLGKKRFMVRFTPEWRLRLDSEDRLLKDDYLVHLPRSA